MKQILTLILMTFTLTCLGTTVKVKRVIDGDTFETVTGEKVRLVGINAPEISDIFGEEAKQHLINLIDGKMIELVPDNISNDKDRYGRLLRYVIYGNTDINRQMLLDGYAFAYLKYHFDKETEYRQAQITAKTNNTGIWDSNQKTQTGPQLKNTYQNNYLNISTESCLVGALIITLIGIGFYYYYKK